MKKPAAAKPPPAKTAPAAGAAKAGAVAAGGHAGKAPAKAAKPAAKKAAPVSAKAKAAAKTKAAKTKAANAQKARQLALGEGVACCVAEAVAASLRLAGWPVSDADVLALYLRTARDLDAGAPILATLEAAAEYGLAGIRPVTWEPAEAADFMPGFMPPLILGLALPAPHAVLDTGGEWITWGEAWPVTAFPDAVIEEAWTVEWGL